MIIQALPRIPAEDGFHNGFIVWFHPMLDGVAMALTVRMVFLFGSLFKHILDR